MPAGSWLRDLLFYVIAAVVVIVYGFIGKINMAMALGFIGIYFVYFAIVLVVGYFAFFNNF